MGVVLKSAKYFLRNFSSAADRLVLRFPYDQLGDSWLVAVTAELRRGAYDKNWDPPFFEVTFSVELHFDEAAELQPHEEDDIAAWNAALATQIPVRLEFLLRLWSSQCPVWITSLEDSRDETDLKGMRAPASAYVLGPEETSHIERLAEKTAVVWGGIERLEYTLLKERMRAGMRNENQFDYATLLQGGNRLLYEKHFAQALAVKWYGLCFQRERRLGSEQAALAPIVGLEALFSEDTRGRKDHVRSRPAALVGRNPEEVRGILEEADRLYKLRNTVVHSGGLTGNPNRGRGITGAELLRCCLGLHALLAAQGLTRNQINSELDQSNGDRLREQMRQYVSSEIVLDRFTPFGFRRIWQSPEVGPT